MKACQEEAVKGYREWLCEVVRRRPCKVIFGEVSMEVSKSKFQEITAVQLSSYCYRCVEGY